MQSLSRKTWKRLLLTFAMLGGYGVHLSLLVICTPFLQVEPWDAGFLLLLSVHVVSYSFFGMLIWHAAQGEVQ